MKGVGSYLDRHGKRRWRLRRAGKTIQLPGSPGSPEFEAALAAPVSATDLKKRKSFDGHFHVAVSKAKERAQIKSVPFDLNHEMLDLILERQDWCYAVSGLPFDRRANAPAAFRPSIDRIEPRKGYVADNVRIVCRIVNLAMSDWGSEPLLKVARAIVDRADAS